MNTTTTIKVLITVTLNTKLQGHFIYILKTTNKKCAAWLAGKIAASSLARAAL